MKTTLKCAVALGISLLFAACDGGGNALSGKDSFPLVARANDRLGLTTNNGWTYLELQRRYPTKEAYEKDFDAILKQCKEADKYRESEEYKTAYDRFKKEFEKTLRVTPEMVKLDKEKAILRNMSEICAEFKYFPQRVNYLPFSEYEKRWNDENE